MDSEIDKIKYDRQIRLFGTEIQQKLCSLKIQIAGIANFTSSEIIKNIVLLGIGNIIVTKEMLEEVGRLIPDPLESINENLKIKISEDFEECDFCFIIGKCKDCFNSQGNHKSNGDKFFVCASCYTIEFNPENQSDFKYSDDENDALLVAKKCLIGALAVQEFIKFIQNKDFTRKFKVDWL